MEIMTALISPTKAKREAAVTARAAKHHRLYGLTTAHDLGIARGVETIFSLIRLTIGIG